MPYSARIVADSQNSQGDRLTTFEVTYPKFVHNEVMTHRMFSRNTASSRAIPYSRMRTQVMEDPVMPVWWGKNQKGMQAREELNPIEKRLAIARWLAARDYGVHQADLLNECGTHKQIVNRVIEPWMWITAIVTATDYDNFFHLRCHPDAQPEVRHIAEMMRDLYYDPPEEVKTLNYGDWHLPYIHEDDFTDVGWGQEALRTLCEVSTARCARVSYLTHDGRRDHAEDLRLFNDLRTQGHWSPFEHVATPMNPTYKFSVPRLVPTVEGYLGNVKGWIQFRKFFPDEYFIEYIP